MRYIELVSIPKPYGTGLFESGIATILNKFEKVKGELPCRYTQRILPSGIKLDFFTATEENWGHILAIRTGSSEFSKRLAKRWVACGYKSIDGCLTRDGQRIETREEKDLFRILGLDYVEPEDRKM